MGRSLAAGTLRLTSSKANFEWRDRDEAAQLLPNGRWFRPARRMFTRAALKTMHSIRQMLPHVCFRESHALTLQGASNYSYASDGRAAIVRSQVVCVPGRTTPLTL